MGRALQIAQDMIEKLVRVVPRLLIRWHVREDFAFASGVVFSDRDILYVRWGLAWCIVEDDNLINAEDGRSTGNAAGELVLLLDDSSTVPWSVRFKIARRIHSK
jgi:hypothetical protein